jgi:excisionase family DNA binding protein
MLFISGTEVEILDMETPESLDTIVGKRRTAWTVEALAELLNVGPSGLYKLIKRGKLPAYRINCSIRLDPQAVATWLRSKATI